MISRRFLLVSALSAALLLVASAAMPAAQPSTTPFLGLWITRYDFRTPADVDSIVDRAAALGVTDLIWQARGQADAFYDSKLEPWGRELFRDRPPGDDTPGFDPLARAVDRAHANGLRLHAWVNVFPLWKGTKPPANPAHPYNAHPEWRLFDDKGEPQPLNEHYVIMNPVLTAVHDHIVAVCRDIVTRYKVDGIHLDYVRFVSDTMKQPSAYPRDAQSLELFKAATGRSAVNSKEDADAMRGFIRDRISALVARIKSEAVLSRPGVVLTAAVWRRPDIARDQYMQDAAAWAKSGVLDRAMPMIYTAKDEQFKSDLGAWLAAAPAERISPGLGLHLQSPDQPSRQFTAAQDAGAAGLCLFAYAAMFESVDPEQDKSAKAVADRSAKRDAVAAAIKAITSSPRAAEPAKP